MTHSSPREDEWKMSSNWPPLDLACLYARQQQKLRGRRAKQPLPLLLFLSASRTEKQFITLPDSLSETDTIRNNIKWIMFSSDWYRYNCRPDFCQRGGGAHKQERARVCARTHARTFAAMGQTHRRRNFMPVCLSNMSPLPAPDGLRVLSLMGELMMWATCFGRKNNNKRVFNLQRRKTARRASVPADGPNRYQLLCPLRGNQLWSSKSI